MSAWGEAVLADFSGQSGAAAKPSLKHTPAVAKEHRTWTIQNQTAPERGVRGGLIIYHGTSSDLTVALLGSADEEVCGHA
jgi:hypothetical protein